VAGARRLAHNPRMAPPPDEIPQRYWSVPLDELQTALAATREGLTGLEAAARRLRFGPNTVAAAARYRLLREIARKFTDPLVLLLLVAGGVSAASGELASSAVIAVIVLIGVVLNVVQEYQANRAVERLRAAVALRVQLLRDGAAAEHPASELVPGDVVLLAAGDLVPADGRLLESRDLYVKQAALTGEPYPVEKQPGELGPQAAGLEQASNALFMGSSVISGSARLLVCATGRRTSFGHIAQSLNLRPPPTAFDQGIRDFGLLILRLTVLLVVFVVIVNVALHRPLLESLLFAIALAVGLTPELLPMIVTVTLARGAVRMSRAKVICKQLRALQNLGSMDVLCTDKTGTLTEARIRLVAHLDGNGAESDAVLRYAYLNSWHETGLRSPLDEAILAHQTLDVSRSRKLDEVPFDFERRRVSVLIDDGGERLLVVKGAADDLRRLCATWAPGGSLDRLEPLDQAERERLAALERELAAQGYRALAVAARRVGPELEHAAVDDESELAFVGYVTFVDPPKASAAQALARLRSAGVAVKVVTGDHELVARHVCGEVGLAVAGVLTGAEIEHLDDPALAARAEATTIFARVTPAQKNRIILALKARGHTVGFLGDGINDAPSMHTADIGISVDGAVDVAKEAAQMILLEPDLGVLHVGVLEGRRTFANVTKYILMGTSSNFGNMFSMAGASLFLPFLPMTSLQILLNNLMYDVSEVPIPLDRVDAEELDRPRAWDVGFIRRFMLVIGPVSSVFDLLTFYVLLKVFAASEALFHTGWFIESLATQVLVIFVIRTRGAPWASAPHPALALTSIAVVALGIALPYTRLGAALGFVAPPAAFLAALAAMVATYLLLTEFVKRMFYARYGRGRPGPQLPR
jgi:Mg2+-importing ATPase